MKRSELVRKTPLRSTSTLKRTKGIEPSQEKPKKNKPKLLKCRAKECHERYQFDPAQPFKCWCSDDCAVAIAQARIAAQKAKKQKAERAEIKRRKEEEMSIKDRLKATEKLVNHYVVHVRDRDDGCISCHMPSHYDGVWHASHFKSVGSNSALRFNLWNIHKSCEQCNFFKAGNIAEYEKRLVLKIGADRIEWLKNHKRSREYDHEYLKRLCSIMRRKISRAKKRHGIGGLK